MRKPPTLPIISHAMAKGNTTAITVSKGTSNGINRSGTPHIIANGARTKAIMKRRPLL